MTSHSAPDYLASLKVSNAEFELLSGISFSVKLYRQNKKCPICAMVIIPEGNIMFDKSSLAEAWVWIDSSKSIVPLNSEIVFQFLEPCDPMMTDTEYEVIKKIIGVKVTGTIKSKY